MREFPVPLEAITEVDPTFEPELIAAAQRAVSAGLGRHQRLPDGTTIYTHDKGGRGVRSQAFEVRLTIGL